MFSCFFVFVLLLLFSHLFFPWCLRCYCCFAACVLLYMLLHPMLCNLSVDTAVVFSLHLVFSFLCVFIVIVDCASLCVVLVLLLLFLLPVFCFVFVLVLY